MLWCIIILFSQRVFGGPAPVPCGFVPAWSACGLGRSSRSKRCGLSWSNRSNSCSLGRSSRSNSCSLGRSSRCKRCGLGRSTRSKRLILFDFKQRFVDGANVGKTSAISLNH